MVGVPDTKGMKERKEGRKQSPHELGMIKEFLNIVYRREYLPIYLPTYLPTYLEI